MYYSARKLGKIFGLTAQEMNVALKKLGYILGQPGYYFPTEKGMPFFKANYCSNGYGGYASSSWTEFTYDESILKQLIPEMTNDICQKVKDFVKEQRLANKAVEAAELFADKISTCKESVNATKILQMNSKQIKTAGIVALAVIGTAAITTAVVICVKRAKKNKGNKTLSAEMILQEEQ